MPNTQQVVVTTPPAVSTPLFGVASGSGVSSTFFTPQLGRDMYLTLTGTWVGTIKLQRSTDAGSSWHDITAGGSPWCVFTGNADEVVQHPTDAQGVYRLSYVLSSGACNYRLAQ